MTVAELIAELSMMDQTRLVVLQKDAEGNGYSPLAGADDNAGYEAETTWSGEVKRQRLTADDRAAGYTKDDVCGKRAVPCVVLWPVN
jgi:hypothetical protein